MGLRDKMVKQFSKPQGLLGKLAGFIMAKRASNIERNRWGISLLDVQPDNMVLEIGCGPGVAVEIIASQLTTGKIMALDHSDVMINMAKKRNKNLIKMGKAEFLRTEFMLYKSQSNALTEFFLQMLCNSGMILLQFL